MQWAGRVRHAGAVEGDGRNGVVDDREVDILDFQRGCSLRAPIFDDDGALFDDQGVDAFAQVGRTGNAALVAAVMRAVGPAPGVVLELYAGSGNLTRHLVRAGATAVSACDGDPAAISRGARNVPEARWSLRPPVIDADTIVLDPPRDGADKAHLAAATRARRRVVYVSCDPQTLGRDARGLRAAGFELIEAVALDLMPQTFHVEVVATFDRA